MKTNYLSLLLALSLLVICGGSTCADDLSRMAPSNALHQAASNNDLSGIDYALNRGYHVDLRDENDNTGLHFAASYGKVDAAKRLLERGANPNARDRAGRTPLHIASPQAEGQIFYRKYAATIDVLLDHGAMIDARDNYGDTPLHRATYWNIADNVELLIHRGADRYARNNSGQTAYELAQDNYRRERESVDACHMTSDRFCSLERLIRIERNLAVLR